MKTIAQKPLTDASARTRAHAPATQLKPKKDQLFVLIACEESQAETEAFRDLGHVAFSCDLQPCRKGTDPRHHIQGDVTEYLQGRRDFFTQSGHYYQVPRWDLIIAHPPCTYLCKVSSVHMYRQDGTIEWSRLRSMILARRFFMLCLNAKALFVAVENPLPMARAELPKPTTYICPSWFGVKYTKKTLFWLRNLPPIFPEIIHSHPKQYVHCSRGKYRSRTFPQVARAIARQWSEYILESR